MESLFSLSLPPFSRNWRRPVVVRSQNPAGHVSNWRRPVVARSQNPAGHVVNWRRPVVVRSQNPAGHVSNWRRPGNGGRKWRRPVVEGNGGKPKATVGGVGISGVPTTNYVVPLDKASSGITRPLVEILRDLNKRVPDNIIDPDRSSISWYHVNRMLSFYAPGWCGEVRDVIYSDAGLVTVVYRIIIHGNDGEAHREATGTSLVKDGRIEEAVASAEESAFCKACARFGFGLYLYHRDEFR